MKTRLLGFALIGMLCGAPAAADIYTDTSAENIQNLASVEQALVYYHDHGNYQDDIARVEKGAADYVAQHAPGKLAIVLDIDETSLSNWDEMVADDFAYFKNAPCTIEDGKVSSPCGALAWDSLAKATAIGPTLALFKLAQSKGIRVFFITGRHELERKATTEGLHAAGYLGWDDADLLMEPDNLKVNSAADFKAPERAWIEKQGYTIIANVGDQLSDLAGDHAERAYKLPNPFYEVP